MLDQQKFKALAANQQILLEIFGAMQEIKLTGSEEIKKAHNGNRYRKDHLA